jgi:parvulin-like peptidyl-prolyl isomerase
MEFAAAIESATPGEWFGPVRSGFGLHLVLIEDFQAGREPPLDEVRQAVERDYLAARITETKDAFYEELRKRYTVRIEAEMPASDDS